VYAFLSGLSPAEAVEWGAAHGALAMTTPGDASMATRDEVERVLRGGTGRVVR
jgi:2-dehydro-3-deoxygluconokinase